jgi:uncharacterized damage-inducible protein DinB
MPSIGESLLDEFDAEMASTRRILERVPDGQGDWKPHDKSTTLARLATHVAELPFWTVNSLANDHVDIAGFKPTDIASAADRVALFDENVRQGRAALAAAADEDFAKPWELRYGAKAMIKQSRGKTYRVFTMNHLIHHRAQLGVYLRLLGVALPGIYGPTADERPF